MKIRLIGTGGQGIVLAATLLGRAATLYDGKYAVKTQASMTAAARRGIVKADVMIEDKPVIEIVFEEPDILLLLSQAKVRYGGKCKVIADSSLGIKDVISRPFISTAHKLRDLRVANMVALGFLAKLGVISLEALKKSIDDMIPEKNREVNKKAVDAGFRL